MCGAVHTHEHKRTVYSYIPAEKSKDFTQTDVETAADAADANNAWTTPYVCLYIRVYIRVCVCTYACMYV